MGVPGLFEALKPITKQILLSDLNGYTVGIDGYVWLHRASFSCAQDLVSGRETTKFLEYFERRVNLLESSGIKPYFVFDGDDLPIKTRINASRGARRRAAKADFEANPNSKNASVALEITPKMAACVCGFLKARRIPFVVAPFEADAQLVYLQQNGIVDAVMSEDSDLIVFGCTKLIAKFKDTHAQLIDMTQQHKAPVLASLRSPEMLRALAIIAGCDYSEGIHGIGVIKAAQLLSSCPCLETALSRVAATQNFRKQAEEANICFQYQRVWDPIKKELTTLNPTDKEHSDELIGHKKHNFRKAFGIVCPVTQEHIVLPPQVSLFIASAGSRKPKISAPIKQPTYNNRVVRFYSSPNATEKSPFFANISARSGKPNSKENVSPTPATRTPSIPSPDSSPIRVHKSSTIDEGKLDFFKPKKRQALNEISVNSSGNCQHAPAPKLDLSRFAFTRE